LAQQWLTLTLLAAIIVSAVYAVERTSADTRRANDLTALVRSKAIEVCADTSGAAVLVVAFKEEVAYRSDVRGEHEAAKIYRGLARGGLDLIPLPAGMEKFRHTLADVAHRGDHFSLSQRSRMLILNGCTQVYSPEAVKPKLGKQADDSKK
jgi:hypothetical protein